MVNLKHRSDRNLNALLVIIVVRHFVIAMNTKEHLDLDKSPKITDK